MIKNKKLLLILASLLLTSLLISCANLVGDVSGGFYTSVNNEFKVKTPAIPKLSVQDGILNDRIFVDFYQSRGFWKTHGLYSIEWYKPKLKIISDKIFYSHTKNTSVSYVKSNFGSRGTFDIIDTRKLKVNEHSAYQFIANGILDNVDAVWIGTAIKFDQFIGLVSVVIYSENANNTELHGATVQTAIPWKKYNVFLQSLTKLKSQ